MRASRRRSPCSRPGRRSPRRQRLVDLEPRVRDVGQAPLAVLLQSCGAAACGCDGGVVAGSALKSGSRSMIAREHIGDLVALERAPSGQHLVEHARRTPRCPRACRPACRAPAPAPCTPPCRGSRPASVAAGVVSVGELRESPPSRRRSPRAPAPSPARSPAPSPCHRRGP